MGKPSSGSSYPGAPTHGSFSYEDMGSGMGHDYNKQLYGSSTVGKPTSSATGSSDATFKHLDSKGSAGYGYPTSMHVPGGTAGGFVNPATAGFMQVRGGRGLGMVTIFSPT